MYSLAHEINCRRRADSSRVLPGSLDRCPLLCFIRKLARSRQVRKCARRLIRVSSCPLRGRRSHSSFSPSPLPPNEDENCCRSVMRLDDSLHARHDHGPNLSRSHAVNCGTAEEADKGVRRQLQLASRFANYVLSHLGGGEVITNLRVHTTPVLRLDVVQIKRDGYRYLAHDAQLCFNRTTNDPPAVRSTPGICLITPHSAPGHPS